MRGGKKLSFLILFAVFFNFLSLLSGAPKASAQENTPNALIWGVRGKVNAILTEGNYAYLGGAFDYVAPNTGAGILLDAESGDLLNFPKFNSQIEAAVPDGQGGFYVGGNFTKINGLDHSYLAHILADGRVDQTWKPEIIRPMLRLVDSPVLALALGPNNILYVGGDFTRINQESRNYIAAFDLNTGQLTSWAPTVDSIVRTIVPTNDAIYIGGDFKQVAEETRNHLAALDPFTGEPTSWSPQANHSVKTMALGLNGNTLYVGGYFTQINGENRNFIAEIDVNGNVTSWNPGCNETVQSIAIDNSLNVIYAGGLFTQIGGESRNYLAAIEAEGDGTVTSWNPEPDNVVYTLLLKEGNLYVGGGFTSLGGQPRFYIGAVETNSGNATSWHPSVGGLVTTLSFNDSRSKILAGGEFTLAGGVFRNNLVQIDLNTGRATPWRADTNGEVFSLAFNPDKSIIYVGGNFNDVSGDSRNYLAAINVSSGLVTNWQPIVDGRVRALAVSPDGSTIYIGGEFNQVGGQNRAHIAGIDNISGEPTSFNPEPIRIFHVYTIALNKEGTVLYFGNYHKRCPPPPRHPLRPPFPPFPPPQCHYAGNVHAFDLSFDNLELWSITADRGIRSLSLSEDNGKLFIGGDFTIFGSESRQKIAAVNALNGEINSEFIPSANSEVRNLLVDGGNVYVGGDFNIINTAPRNLAASLSASNGEVDSWDPNFTGVNILSFAINKNLGQLLVGGYFDEVGGKIHNNFAVFDLPVVNFSQTSGSGSQELTWPEVRVSLSQAASENVTVDYTVEGGTAIAGYDYILNSGTLTIHAGSTKANIPLQILKPSAYRPDRTIIIKLLNARHATLGNNNSFTYTITKNIGGGGGLPAEAFSPPIAPKGGFKVLINDDDKLTSKPMVKLTLFGGPNTERMSISNFSDFRDAVQEPYQTVKEWNICQGLTSCPSGIYTVYAKFYTKWGQSSEIVFDSINYQKETTVKEEPEVKPGEQLEEQRVEKEKIEVCLPYLTKYIKYGSKNDQEEVKKLKRFLKDYEGLKNIEETGFYDKKTFDAVVKFQEKYAQEILAPWGLVKGTGFIYTKTIEKINKLYCQKEKPGALVCPVFTKSYRLGMVDAGISLVQKFLKIFKFLPQNHVVNNVFNLKVFEAVKDYQQKYADKILKPLGLKNPTGFWGPASRAEANLLINCK